MSADDIAILIGLLVNLIIGYYVGLSEGKLKANKKNFKP